MHLSKVSENVRMEPHLSRQVVCDEKSCGHVVAAAIVCMQQTCCVFMHKDHRSIVAWAYAPPTKIPLRFLNS